MGTTIFSIEETRLDYGVQFEHSLAEEGGLFIFVGKESVGASEHLTKNQTKELIRALVKELPDYESEEFTYYRSTESKLYYRVSSEDSNPENPIMVLLHSDGLPIRPGGDCRAEDYLTPQSAFKATFVKVTKSEVMG